MSETGNPCVVCGLSFSHAEWCYRSTPAPAAPPEGEGFTAIIAGQLRLLRLKAAHGDFDAADVVQQAIEKDIRAALAAATARAEELRKLAEASHLAASNSAKRANEAQAEAERLRGERASAIRAIQQEREAWAANLADADRRVEAMREAAAKVCAENCQGRAVTTPEEIRRIPLPATPAPGPRAEGALRWAYWELRPESSEHAASQFVARALADLTRAPGGQDAPDAARKEGV